MRNPKLAHILVKSCEQQIKILYEPTLYLEISQIVVKKTLQVYDPQNVGDPQNTGLNSGNFS